MKVLLIHNSHRTGSSSGDDIVFRKEAELLESHKHTVIRYIRSNDEFDRSNFLNKIYFVFQISWSFQSYKAIKNIITKDKPDIVHIHNIFPFLSPSIYYAIQSQGIPLVQTLHDFRLLCPMAYLLRKGLFCRECKEGAYFNSVKYGCFKNSRIQSIPVALMLKLHHLLGTFKNKVDAYICLTLSQKKIYLDSGFDEDELFLKPNFVEQTLTTNDNNPGDYVVFIGRLGEEKGISTLIKAFKTLPVVPLKIVGNGPEAEKIKFIVEKLNIKNIEFLGYKPYDECMKILGGAKFLVMPSIWYETFGLTIIEAFLHSKPVIASNMGAMADIVHDEITGLLFEPGNSDDLSKKVRLLWDNPDKCIRMGQNTKKEYEEKYTAEKNYDMLMNIYEEVISRKRNINNN